MPNEEDPDLNAWKKKISSELSLLGKDVLVVAHSLGGSALLRYLADDGVPASIAGTFVLAAPAWDGDRWNFDELKMPGDLGKTLAPISKLFFYHCRDDNTVPFSHLALHQSLIPQAVTRAFDSGGHQFAGELSSVAADIRGDRAVHRGTRSRG
jgi:predicted alpha/beta hydrolase family esterase